MLHLVGLTLALTHPPCETSSQYWKKLELPSPCALTQPKTRPAQVDAFVKQWHLTPPAAECAANAATSAPPVIETGYEAAEGNPAQWLACARRFPQEAPLWLALGQSLVAANHPFDAASLEALDDATRAMPDDAAVSLLRALLTGADRGPHHGSSAAIARRLVARAPDQLRATLRALPLGFEGLSFAMSVLDDAEHRATPLPLLDLAAAAELALACALKERQFQFAAEVWQRLPQGLRAAEAKGINDLPDSSTNTLLLALLSSGELDAARLLRRLPNDVDVLQEAVITFALTQKRTLSTFDAAKLTYRARFPQEALPLLAAYLGPDEDFVADAVSKAFVGSELPSAPKSPHSDPALEERLSAAHERALERLRTLPGAPLRSPTPWSVAPSPFTVETTPSVGRTPVTLRASTLGIASEFTVIRAEQSGTRQVVLATSHLLDPGAGGCWLLVRAKGAQWEQLYLGQREPRLAETVPSSRVPLLDGDTVRLEVDDRTAPSPKRVVLTATLQQLRLDTDGDGWSDLIESRLLLDPTKADTDGDGASDAVDLEPRLPSGGTPSAKTQLLQAYFGPARDEATPPSVTARGSVVYLVGPQASFAGLHTQRTIITLSREEFSAAIATFGRFFPLSVHATISDDGAHGYLIWTGRSHGGSYTAARSPDGSWSLTVDREWRI